MPTRRVRDLDVVTAFLTVWEHLVVADEITPSDAIFCFGSRHWRVPERAAELWRQGVAPRVLVSGGPSAPAATSEAEIFAADLVRRGVPIERIVVEPHARHTGENVLLGLAALRADEDVRRLTLVSWPLAARRCRATVAHVAPSVAAASAPALRTPDRRWYPTGNRIRRAVGEMDRLDRYGALGLLTPETPPAAVQEAIEVLRSWLADRPDLVMGGSADDSLGGAIPPSRSAGEAEQAPLFGVES